MSTTSTPRAPATGNTSMPKAGTPTGSWRHPAMDTIVQRQSKQKGLADIHSSRLAKNSGAFVATFVFTCPAYGKQPERHPVWDDIMWLGTYILNTLRIVLLYNMGESTYRLLRSEPDFSDLPLTPMQRQLLGLAPNGSSTPTPPQAGTSPPPGIPVPPPSPPAPLAALPGQAATAFHHPPLLRRLIHHLLLQPPPRPLSQPHFFQRNRRANDPSPLRSTPAGAPWPRVWGLDWTGLGIGLRQCEWGGGAKWCADGNRWVYEKMGRRGEGLRWTPGRNSVFSPVKGQVN
ncbi:hypothetical protein BGX38DRAFT_1270917 [Terfezia claveryi]|nr:hypothetical protein BGX38DRAFT_1270917 [Terfezia claveryi]